MIPASERGLSLVEVTIMLLVLMLLTAVLAPTVGDFIHDAQWVKVKEDCEAIGISVTRLVRDIGPCLKASQASACDLAHRVDILISRGATGTIAGSAFSDPGTMASTNWDAPGGVANQDTLENQLVVNAPGYSTPMDRASAGGYGYTASPVFGLGWRGAYLAPPIAADPWGTRYYVNSGFLAVASDASGASDGGAGGWWEHDVICLSAGPDQRVSTRFAAENLYRRGTEHRDDDFIHVISGSGR